MVDRERCTKNRRRHIIMPQSRQKRATRPTLKSEDRRLRTRLIDCTRMRTLPSSLSEAEASDSPPLTSSSTFLLRRSQRLLRND